jgi:leader peptidase (prepilin peptidase)/N-methyltransferase
MPMDDTALRIAIALPLGLIIGSFMTVVVARVPAKESLLRPRSRCPRCGTPIRNRDNIPVLGWLLLRGRCRSCGERISIVYPIVELATAAVIVGAVLVYEDLWIAVGIAALLALMPALSAIDLRHRVIPNAIVYPALIAFPLYLTVAWIAGAPVDLGRMGLGFLAYGGGLFVIALIAPGGMGMGDVKLCALIGAVLGSLGLAYVAVAAGAAIVIGGVAAVVALVGGKGRKAKMPFGPAIALGAIVAAFWGQAIADRYLGAMGG